MVSGLVLWAPVSPLPLHLKKSLCRHRPLTSAMSLPVLVSIVITDGDGSQTQPCAVAVTVLPRLHGDRCPGEDM